MFTLPSLDAFLFLIVDKVEQNTVIYIWPFILILCVGPREWTIQARTDTIRYEYSSIRDGRYRYEYSLR